ncbi:hypothetical protein CJ030_MR6G029283 [Morella rubra]|uniref:Uncharacterized protein n=1 Tax=Morella rubra TaxID=262757 RepID=A0A6A1VAX0_9ROSI|nr:hypothetical protein CJ030_MR6G029283 [Morella rubra]
MDEDCDTLCQGPTFCPNFTEETPTLEANSLSVVVATPPNIVQVQAPPTAATKARPFFWPAWGSPKAKLKCHWASYLQRSLTANEPMQVVPKRLYAYVAMEDETQDSDLSTPLRDLIFQ